MLGFYLKAFHIIFVVTWFAGLFYIVRLFVHYAEANQRPELERKILQEQYKKMAKGLWLGIAYPSMILTIILGFSLLYYFNYWKMPWMHLKLAFVGLLVAYHFYCGTLYRQVQNDTLVKTSFFLRIYNELASVLLIAIVFTIVFKYAVFSSAFGLLLIGLCILLIIAVYLFKLKRAKKEKNEA